ncbi:MAG: hypothetical protein E6J15_13485 [Chloroflexi bacterium]|nr:MAG: hypothetical protein E6J15_13485 [Chloroflexota bacterium]
MRLGRNEETRAYAAAVDPRPLAQLLFDRPSTPWALLEVARNVLVFAPIAVTWYGLSAASLAYAKLLHDRPDLVTQPFLLLWEVGFLGAQGVLNFSTVAMIDASLICILIVLSLALHARSELRGPATRTRTLLKESAIRGLVGHATSLASNDLSGPDADAVLDEMVAEERRIYERAMEREQQLFDLEGAVRDLRQAAADLTRAAGTLSGRGEGAEPEDELPRIGRASGGRM